jgi:tRNA threonylcarbamoyladenosine biosynthesis protein TsaE
MKAAGFLADAAATEALGQALARSLQALSGPCVLTLSGELGAGKTTLTRGLLRALGERGAVRSPTYTLIETYALGGRQVHHLDLYRLRDAAEVEGLGVRELLSDGALLIVEWPERDVRLAACADLAVNLRYDADGRRAEIGACTAQGRQWLGALAAEQCAVTVVS